MLHRDMPIIKRFNHHVSKPTVKPVKDKEKVQPIYDALDERKTNEAKEMYYRLFPEAKKIK